jgi:hypothetical protein
MSERARSWRRWLAKWRRSGLTQAEFCRRFGLKAVTFAWWKRRLSAEGGTTPAADVPSPGRPVGRPSRRSSWGRRGIARGTARDTARDTARSTARAFVEVPIPRPASTSYEIILERGRIIRLPRDFDPQTVSRLITAVESATGQPVVVTRPTC